MPDDKDQNLSQPQSDSQQSQQGSSSNSFPYEDTTTRIRKSDDGNELGENSTRNFPREHKSSEE
jgi:hypothetical protein